MTPLPVSAAATERSKIAGYAARAGRSAGAGVAIGLLIGGFRDSLWISLVHSVCISMCCWFAIDLARIPLARWAHRRDPPDAPTSAQAWPGWPLMMVAVVLGSAFGFGVGGTIANRILGGGAPTLFDRDGRALLSVLLIALVPGTAITYWFYARETIAAKEAAKLAAERQAAEHQLKLLESQLEPHMLFNTLANLRVLIGLDPPRAQALLDQLIAFLRATLAGSRAAHHGLDAEFARLADYLALMQVRMGERLGSSFDLPTALAGQPVPPLLLQPLVENAIKHGLEPSVDGGRIEIAAARDGDTLVLSVRDTGVGLAAAAAAATDGMRFGLEQVRERLATRYGRAASLTLAPAEAAGGGTLATIRLPLAPTEGATTAPAPPSSRPAFARPLPPAR